MNKNTKKARTINALRKIIKNIERDGKDPTMGNTHNCSLCKIHYANRYVYHNDCTGCPLEEADASGYGCVEVKDAFSIDFHKMGREHLPHLRTLLTMLMEYPEEQFTKKHWKPFGIKERLIELFKS